MCKEIENSGLLAYSFNLLGTISSNQLKYDKALRYLKKSIYHAAMIASIFVGFDKTKSNLLSKKISWEKKNKPVKIVSIVHS